jgi:hypothetical protein
MPSIFTLEMAVTVALCGADADYEESVRNGHTARRPIATPVALNPIMSRRSATRDVVLTLFVPAARAQVVTHVETARETIPI